jgi:hypothetical protein
MQYASAFCILIWNSENQEVSFAERPGLMIWLSQRQNLHTGLGFPQIPFLIF